MFILLLAANYQLLTPLTVAFYFLILCNLLNLVLNFCVPEDKNGQIQK